ncbi:MAG TPA: CBS domain-containing protein [Phnomibacter sp.]|nr:CBS domain-containing protein [Phnomibacter sp.]
MTTVASVLALKPRPFNFVEPTALVADALNLLGTVNMSYLVVMREQEFRGIFCEHDYCRNVAMRGWDPAVCKVEDAMTTNLPTVSPEDSVESCIRLFNAHKVRYIPVFDQYRFVGVITQGDLIRSLLRHGKNVFDNSDGRVKEPEWYGQVI